MSDHVALLIVGLIAVVTSVAAMWTIVTDVKRRKIPNKFMLIVTAGIFVEAVVSHLLPHASWITVLIGVVAWALWLFVAFGFMHWGGGDAKLIGATWLLAAVQGSVGGALVMLLVDGVLLCVSIVIALIGRKIPRFKKSRPLAVVLAPAFILAQLFTALTFIAR